MNKKTLFWIIVLIVLGGAFYLFDQHAGEVNKAKQANLRLFSFEVLDVAEFWIKRNQKETVRVAREGTGWQITEPLRAKGDDEFIAKYLNNIVTARKDAILFSEPEPSKLKELGLDAPELEMGFKAKGSDTLILFGAKGPTHNVSYAMFKGDPNVYRIHSDVKKEADKNSYELRDKTISDIDPLKMKRFEIERKGMDKVVIEHDKGKWTMAEPKSARAAMAKVLETLYEIKNAEAKAFIDDETPGADYGFDSPKAKVIVIGEKTPYSLTIGNKDRTRRGYFAASSRVNNVFVVEESLVNSLFANADTWKEELGIRN